MEELTQYIKPELLIVSVVLFLIGMGIQKANFIKEKYIPILQGAVGVLICGIYIFATCDCGGIRGSAMGVFTAITQGILTAGLGIYGYKIWKKNKKEE